MVGIRLRDTLRPVIPISMPFPSRRFPLLVMVALPGLVAALAEEPTNNGTNGATVMSPVEMSSNPPTAEETTPESESLVAPEVSPATMEKPMEFPPTQAPSPAPDESPVSGERIGAQDAPEPSPSPEAILPAESSPTPVSLPSPESTVPLPAAAPSPSPAVLPAVPESVVPTPVAPSLEEIDASLVSPERGSGKKKFKVNREQGDAVIYEERLAGKNPEEPFQVLISLSRQRLYLLSGNDVVLESPIASGRKAGWTPKGSFSILEKELNHRSNRYGDLVDANGGVIRRNVVNGAKGGTFRGAPMKYFMRLTYEGVGMHAGILPGYPASHGCIRLPHDVAEFLYGKLRIKTSVWVVD